MQKSIAQYGTSVSVVTILGGKKKDCDLVHSGYFSSCGFVLRLSVFARFYCLNFICESRSYFFC